MNYRYQTALKRRRHRAAQPAYDGRFDRVMQIGTLFTNALVGLGTVALAFVGLQVTREFNEWQQSKSIEQEATDETRETRAIAMQLKDRCIQVADIGTKIAMGRGRQDAVNILRLLETMEPDCPKVGINLTTLSAALVIQRAPQFDRAVVAQAAAIISSRPRQTNLRVSDRFSLGGPQMRGFDIRGIGPRVERMPYNDSQQIIDDALGGRAYYQDRAEIELPVNPSSSKELGLRPYLFFDVGSVFVVPDRAEEPSKPRLDMGSGVAWNSPFGPFRIDVAKVLLREDGDDTKLLTFNTGTTF